MSSEQEKDGAGEISRRKLGFSHHLDIYLGLVKELQISNMESSNKTISIFRKLCKVQKFRGMS
jgi:hypothetical protein